MRHDLERELWRWTRPMGDPHGRVPRTWIQSALDVGIVEAGSKEEAISKARELRIYDPKVFKLSECRPGWSFFT